MLDSIPSISTLRLSTLDPERSAFFLDFDGTLAPIAEHPDAVSVPPETLGALALLLNEAAVLAIVTGRSIADIDRFLSPLELPVAGVHGLERRSADGTISTAPIDEQALADVSIRLTHFAALHPGLLLEPKRGSVALHYRQRPDLANICTCAVARAVEPYPQLHVLPGKMVIEIKGSTATKADAIAAFMAEEPFIGRTPFFAGDDVTDEQAFPVINRLGGISLKIGQGQTSAAYRCPGPAAFSEWLAQLASSSGNTKREMKLS